MNLVHPPSCPPPPPKEKKISQPLFSISPGYYSRPKRNPRQWLCESFSFKGLGGGVNKVLYVLCENGEYSWTFSPKTRALIGYFEVT